MRGSKVLLLKKCVQPLSGFRVEISQHLPSHSENNNRHCIECLCVKFPRQWYVPYPKHLSLKRVEINHGEPRAPRCSHHGDSKGKGACWLDQRLSLSQHCSFPHQLRVAQNWIHQIHRDGLKPASFLKAKKKWRLNSDATIISQEKDLCSHESHTSAPLPPSKFLLVPGIRNQLIWIFPDSDRIQAEFWSLKDVHYWTIS